MALQNGLITDQVVSPATHIDVESSAFEELIRPVLVLVIMPARIVPLVVRLYMLLTVVPRVLIL